MDWLLTVYPWIKAFHIISVMAWMAGLLYLPRLFIYHCDAGPGSEKSETFKVMERRLLFVIMNPAMVLSFFFGVMLFLTPGVIDWSAWWVYGKVFLIILLVFVHLLFAVWLKGFAEDQNQISAKTLRVANEMPTVLMIGIVILVIVRPGA
ncbi:MAG: TIGR00701 family protein [Rhodospirillaceae bacterium]|nr:TIGR00701 family protein [Rhodospirillaceae bacterium]|tara:strand:+ start:933 stop:1382 length:450 start_codon:yes stop_codon:yes gene_type:complete